MNGCGAARVYGGVGIADMAILANNEWDQWVTIEGYAAGPGETMDPHFNAVSPGYFDTLGMRVLQRPRFHARRTTQKAPKVAIVNTKFAKRYFSDGNAVGRHIGLGQRSRARRPISRSSASSTTPGTKACATRYRCRCSSARDTEMHSAPSLYVTMQGDRGSSVSRPIRSVVRELDPTLPITNMKTHGPADRRIAGDGADDRDRCRRVFGTLATALALIGLYGVMAYHGDAAVARDRHPHGARRDGGQCGLAGDAGSADADRLQESRSGCPPRMR